MMLFKIEYRHSATDVSEGRQGVKWEFQQLNTRPKWIKLLLCVQLNSRRTELVWVICSSSAVVCSRGEL